MREKVNNNPLVQVALLAVLLLGTGFFLMSSMGGGEEEGEAGGTEATVTSADTGATATATGETAGEAVESAVESVTSASPTAVSAQPANVAAVAPPPPREVTEAFAADQTVVLLFVRDRGIDDRLVRGATEQLASLPEVATFVVPAGKISRYASITEGVGVDRVPALVVVRPKHLKRTAPTASVSYGFQSGQSVVQAVIDAGYRGPTVDYHP